MKFVWSISRKILPNRFEIANILEQKKSCLENLPMEFRLRVPDSKIMI